MYALVRILYLVLTDKQSVVEHVKHDPCLTDKQRRDALSIARDDYNVANFLNNSSWDVVRSKESTPTGYQHSYDLALEAGRLAPKDGLILNTVGVAQYRLGHYPEAIKLLSESYALNKESRLGEQPADVAFLAMSYARLGRAQEAKAEMVILDRLMRIPLPSSLSLERDAFGKEAAEVMRQTRLR